MQARDTLHRTLADTALPFVTNSSPTSSDAQYVAGQNMVTSIQGKLERRAGFSLGIENTPTAFPAGERIAAIFQWRKWAGAFVTMVCTTTLTSSKVYAYRAGVELSFNLIYTAAATDGKPFSFAVAGNTCYMGNGTATDMRAYDATGTTTRKWGIAAPSIAPTAATGTTGTVVNIFRSWHYVYTYGNSSTAHESSPSPLSVCLGPLTGVNGLVGVVASTDTQVDQIRVYRTTDGGSQDPPDMREISGSPFANATATLPADSTADTALGARTAPEFNRNDPPPGMNGIVFAENSSRMGGFADNNFYYSGFEEIENGVPYECFPSGQDGNFYPMGSEVAGLAPLADGVAIFCADSIVKIEGDSLDTFRRYMLARRQGARNYQAIATLGGLCIWLDTADTVWMMGGQELGLPVRPSLGGIDHSQAQMTIHIEGKRRWLLLLDGANGLVYVFDFDTEQWSLPWTLSATSLHSGETSSGVFRLLCGFTTNQEVMMQMEGTYLDGPSPYPGSAVLGMTDIAPGQKPDWRGIVDFVDIKRDSGPLSGISQLNDDNPSLGSYVSIFANKEDAPLVPQGSFIKAERFTSMPDTNVCRQTSIRLEWPAANQSSELYYLDIGFHPFGG